MARDVAVAADVTAILPDVSWIRAALADVADVDGRLDAANLMRAAAAVVDDVLAMTTLGC